MEHYCMSDSEAIARWKKTMKAGSTWNMKVPMPQKKMFADNSWPSNVREKSMNEKVSTQTPIDPWGSRHRG